MHQAGNVRFLSIPVDIAMWYTINVINFMDVH